VVYLAGEGKIELTRQSEHDQQGSTELLQRLWINAADYLPDTVASERHHLVCHDLRTQAKPVLRFRLNDWAQ